MHKKICNNIVPQGTTQVKHQQLCLALETPQQSSAPRKPQISSIPGISPKVRNRYRVTLAGKVLPVVVFTPQPKQLELIGEGVEA